MRLADDDRGRVPFALVGVLLLVGSATFAASLSTPSPTPVNASADAAAERVDAETTAALRGAVRDAARAAARNPVTAAPDDGAGAALAGPDTFRRYLRLRIFLAAREAVAPVEHRRGDAVARVSLGESVDAVPEALDRVSVSAVDDGTELRATVRGLSLRVQRGGRIVDTRRLNRTVTVAVPVLALHDRTVAFQERLNAGALESPGLERRVTVGLAAVAQARGLGQYAGLPISNVVANHHVALSTNAGLLDAQRAAFGRPDPDATAGVRAATLRTGATDLLSPHTDPRVVSAVTGRLPGPNAPERAADGPATGALPATRTVAVGVNGTADAAFLALLRGERGKSLGSVRRDGYGAAVSVDATRRTVSSDRRPGPDPPGEGWTLAYASTSSDVSVTGGGSARPLTRVGRGERLLYRATRRVVERHTVERVWVKPNVSARTTAASWRDVHRVRVTGTARLDSSRAPSRPARPAFEAGGAVDGPNLREADDTVRRLVSGLGGADGIARNTVTGGRTGDSTSVTGDRPDDLRPWIYADLASLRDRVRNVSVRVAASDAATGGDNGAARLAAVVRDRRAELVDAPREYDGVADRTRVAARAAYLDRVLARLDARAGRTGERNDGIGRALSAAGIAPGRANALADLTPKRPAPRREVGAETGVRGETVLVPDGDPAYLAAGPVDGRVVDGVADDEQYVGLAVRNLNVFAVPYGDAADVVTRTLLGDPGRVSLHAAGGALVAAERTLAEQPDPTLRSRRDALEPKVKRSMGAVRRTARRTVGRPRGARARGDERVAGAGDRRRGGRGTPDSQCRQRGRRGQAPNRTPGRPPAGRDRGAGPRVGGRRRGRGVGEAHRGRAGGEEGGRNRHRAGDHPRDEGETRRRSRRAADLADVQPVGRDGQRLGDRVPGRVRPVRRPHRVRIDDVRPRRHAGCARRRRRRRRRADGTERTDRVQRADGRGCRRPSRRARRRRHRRQRRRAVGRVERPRAGAPVYDADRCVFARVNGE
jgi:hypothetical protein